VWLSFIYHLLHAPPPSFEEWQKKYATALESASKRRFSTDRSLAAIRVFPTPAARKPPKLKNCFAKTNRKYQATDQKRVALGLRPAAFMVTRPQKGKRLGASPPGGIASQVRHRP
jgi:hypothetical protein